MSASKFITFQGETLSASEWARRLGLSRQGLHRRLSTMPLSDALRDEAGRKVVEKRKKATWVEHEGHYYTQANFAQICGVNQRTVREWILAGHVRSVRETPRKCSHCRQQGHRVDVCPKLFLEPGGRRAPFAPPRDSELAARGVDTSQGLPPRVSRPVRLPRSAPPGPEKSTPSRSKKTPSGRAASGRPSSSRRKGSDDA